MPIQKANVKITGVAPLLTNNPQTVDHFNPIGKRISQINAKKTRRTDDDYREIRKLELRAKSYVDSEIGLYVPSSWLTTAIAFTSFAVCKVSKANARGAIFETEGKIPLQCRDRNKIKTVEDIVGNDRFHMLLTIPQGKPRVVKAFPIFHDWSFETVLEYDDKIIDPDSLRRTIEHASKYGGFGDFRPRFGRASAVVTNV